MKNGKVGLLKELWYFFLLQSLGITFLYIIYLFNKWVI